MFNCLYANYKVAAVNVPSVFFDLWLNTLQCNATIPAAKANTVQ